MFKSNTIRLRAGSGSSEGDRAEMLRLCELLISEIKSGGGSSEYTKAKELTEDLHQGFCRHEWILKIGQ